MSRRIEPLRCAACGAPVALVEAAETDCASCGAAVVLPSAHVEALRASRRTDEAQRQAEAIGRRLDRGAPPWAPSLGLVLVVLLPVAATAVACLLPYPPLPRLQIYGLVTVPALVPGAALYLWGEAVAASALRFRDAMSAQPPATSGSPPGCRNCGAPLAIDGAEAVAVTCSYCTADNLVSEVPLGAIQRRLRSALWTLEDAGHRLRRRAISLALGAAALAAMLGAASIALARLAAGSV